MTSNDMVVREGTNVTLTCKAKGFPEPYVMWRREDGDEMSISGENGERYFLDSISIPLISIFFFVPFSFFPIFPLRIIVNVVDGEILSITKVSRLHMAAYLCVASNGVPPSISKRVQLKVQCKKLKTNFPSIKLNFPTVPPMLSIPNQLEGAYAGQDVILECHTEAYPASINYWTTERGDMIISGMQTVLLSSSRHHKRFLFRSFFHQIPRGQVINLKQSRRTVATANSWSSKYEVSDQMISDSTVASLKIHSVRNCSQLNNKDHENCSTKYWFFDFNFYSNLLAYLTHPRRWNRWNDKIGWWV